MANHKHDHDNCKHTALAFCGTCDKPYCKRCGREWANPCTLSHWTSSWTYTTKAIALPFEVTGGTTRNASIIWDDNTKAALLYTTNDHKH